MTRADNSPVPDFANLLRLDGRRFIVVGAGNGMGRQVTHGVVQLGGKAFCVDVNPDLAADVAAEVGGTPWAGDATSRSDVERMVNDAVSVMGGIDGVIDVVGLSHYGGLLELDDAEWDFHHDVCLRHAWLLMQHAGRVMRDGSGGVMVFVASVSGITGAALHAAYGAFKAGLMSLVRSAAVELGPLGIRVNAVAPGVVWTPRVAGYLGEEGRKSNSENAPLRRVALTADIAASLLFLASDLSGYINGQTLVVDGGVGAKFPYPMPSVATSA